MPRRLSKCTPFLLFFAAASASAMPPAPALPADVPAFDQSSCSLPSYPPEASKRGERGITTLGVLVGADGTVRRMELLGSSGSATLDEATQQGWANCRLKPAVVDGRTVERWYMTQYSWEPDKHDQMENFTWLLDVAATQGRPAAQFALYTVLNRQHAMAKRAPPAELTDLLHSAAAAGHCLSKYVLGSLYEFGGAVKPDLRKAREWYEGAAACGNPVATDRLAHMPASR